VPGKYFFNVFLLRRGIDNQGSSVINIIQRVLFFIKGHPLHHSGTTIFPFHEKFMYLPAGFFNQWNL
jgi:hypothetical protein